MDNGTKLNEILEEKKRRKANLGKKKARIGLLCFKFEAAAGGIE